MRSRRLIEKTKRACRSNPEKERIGIVPEPISRVSREAIEVFSPAIEIAAQPLTRWL